MGDADLSDDLVERIARITHPEAFVDFSGWVVSDSDGERPYKPNKVTRARYAYQRSQALHRVAEALAILRHLPPGELARQLADSEIAGWKRLGVPMDRPELQEIVRRKHGLGGQP